MADIKEWTKKGNILLEAGRYEEAIASFDKALEIAPHLSMPWKNKGDILESMGRHAEAAACFQKAEEIDRL